MAQRQQKTTGKQAEAARIQAGKIIDQALGDSRLFQRVFSENESPARGYKQTYGKEAEKGSYFYSMKGKQHYLIVSKGGKTYRLSGEVDQQAIDKTLTILKIAGYTEDAKLKGNYSPQPRRYAHQNPAHEQSERVRNHYEHEQEKSEKRNSRGGLENEVEDEGEQDHNMGKAAVIFFVLIGISILAAFGASMTGNVTGYSLGFSIIGAIFFVVALGVLAYVINAKKKKHL